MPNEQLLAYIRSEVAQGANKTALIQSLLATGWKIEDINIALASVTPAPNRNVPSAPRSPVVPTQPVQHAYSAPQSSQSVSIKRMVQNTAASLFITCIFVLTVVSIMGVWNVFSGDVILKSFETLGLLAFVSVVVIAASKYIGDPNTPGGAPVSSQGFRAIRNSTLGTLIVSSSLLALLGILSIWDVISDKSTLHKSLSSLGIIAFSSLIVVMVCLEREQNPFWEKRSGELSGGAVIAGIILIWILMAFGR